LLRTVTAVVDWVPNITDVTPLKLFPLIVTVVPTGPEVGEKELIVGGAAASAAGVIAASNRAMTIVAAHPRARTRVVSSSRFMVGPLTLELARTVTGQIGRD
jgi:hypothetical protein